jgi:DNA-binding XRE family transcriptional regulator
MSKAGEGRAALSGAALGLPSQSNGDDNLSPEERMSTTQRGEVSYYAAHERVAKRRGLPKKCEICGTTDRSKVYQWANLTGHYDDPEDYKRMCQSCHASFDANRRERMPKADQEKRGELMRRIRHDRNWTQEQMARVIGISRVALTQAENGHFAGERSRSFYLIRKFLEAAQ